MKQVFSFLFCFLFSFINNTAYAQKKSVVKLNKFIQHNNFIFSGKILQQGAYAGQSSVFDYTALVVIDSIYKKSDVLGTRINDTVEVYFNSQAIPLPDNNSIYYTSVWMYDSRIGVLANRISGSSEHAAMIDAIKNEKTISISEKFEKAEKVFLGTVLKLDELLVKANSPPTEEGNFIYRKATIKKLKNYKNQDKEIQQVVFLWRRSAAYANAPYLKEGATGIFILKEKESWQNESSQYVLLNHDEFLPPSDTLIMNTIFNSKKSQKQK